MSRSFHLSALALLGFTLVNVALNVVRSPLRGYPGPWYTCFTHYVLKLKTLTGQRMYYVNDLHKRYGPLVRIAPNQLASCSPDDFETIHRVGSGFNKTQWYEDWTRGKDGEGIGIGLFAMTDPRQAAARRRMFARALSVTSIRANCEDVVKEKVNTAVAKIKSDLVNGKESNVMKWWMLMASDVIGQLSFGESFEQLQVGRKSHFIEVLEAVALGVTLNYEFSGIMTLLKRVPMAALQHVVEAPKSLRKYGQRAVDNLRKHSGVKGNLFATMLAHSEAADDELTDEDVRIEASLFLIAGADSTAVTLTYLVWAVLKRPSLQARLEDEVAALGDDCELDDVVLEKLPLLNAVIEESLRLYGALCGNLSRLVPPGGATLSGFRVPAGTEVETQAFTMHRNPDVFPNPLEFDESRWMGKDASSRPSSYCPWGAGARICQGSHLAKMEMRLAAATLFRECRGLRIGDRMTDDMMDSLNYFLSMPKGHKLEVSMS
ncbi:hypothetical protein N3K66_001823 [Trichothecium roseum]|uniref:Uncharacterized protein n=1 Tax=Trichothecium roseum TaxID=47278 RepID=A0ACC0V7M9_9HYPO|nr:hypothetical protein N3K66_001823 [Trichothecium roseum]